MLNAKSSTNQVLNTLQEQVHQMQEKSKISAESQQWRQHWEQAQRMVEQHVLGKSQEIRLTFAALFSRGHVLLDDVPGTGKTTLARTVAQALGLNFQRVQFTSDMMPADITGVSLLHPKTQQFEWHPGPLFTQILLADEINRASPRTQSALLESMAERQVTIDRTTHALPSPFMVIATQNPIDFQSTFPLPESQLDRFSVRIHLGYPGAKEEQQLYLRQKSTATETSYNTFLDGHAVEAIQRQIETMPITENIAKYVWQLVQRSREDSRVKIGLSPRAGLSVLAMAKAWAWMEGRQHVLPDDVHAIWVASTSHRIVVKQSATNPIALVQEWMSAAST